MLRNVNKPKRYACSLVHHDGEEENDLEITQAIEKNDVPQFPTQNVGNSKVLAKIEVYGEAGRQRPSRATWR